MQCEKKRFYSKKQAKLAVRNHPKDKAWRPRKVYKCKKCGQWHMTCFDASTTAAMRDLKSQFQPGDIWSCDEGHFEILAAPVTVDGLQAIVTYMTRRPADG